MWIVNKIYTSILFKSEIKFSAYPPPPKKNNYMYNIKNPSKKTKIAIDTYATFKKKYINCIYKYDSHIDLKVWKRRKRNIWILRRINTHKVMVLKVVTYLTVDTLSHLGVKRYPVDIGAFNWYATHLSHLLKYALLFGNSQIFDLNVIPCGNSITFE